LVTDSVAKFNYRNSDEAYATIKKRESFAFTLIYFLHLSVMSCPCIYLLPNRSCVWPIKSKLFFTLSV